MYRAFFKRLIDFIFCLIAIVLLSPVFIVVVIAIYMESGRPALYRQVRVGKNLKPFPILKFRSMVINADKIGGYSTAQNDNRITQVGKFLRKTSLDELPQLFNVLKGDMSLVGPRPDVPAQIEQYPDHEAWAKRHQVKPGITGLAQALYRSSATPAQRLNADLSYAQGPTLLGDLNILIKTVEIIFTRRGTN